MHGSTVAVSIVLKHQPRPSSSTTAVPATSTSGSGSAAGAAAAAAAAAATAQAAHAYLEPLTLLSAEEAAGCNVLQLTALSAAPVPQAWPAAAHAAGGGLSCSLQLHLPSGAEKAQLGPRCSGALVSSSSSLQLEWPRQQQSCRMHLSATATAFLKASTSCSTSHP